MPRYEDDDDDDCPSRRNRRRSRDYENDEPIGESTPGNGFAFASMILGIVGFCVPLICGLLAKTGEKILASNRR